MKRFATLFTCIMAAGSMIFAQDKKEKDPPPPPPPPNTEVVKLAPPVAEMNGFYKRNPSVAELYWDKKKNLVIKLKNNTTEKYDLADKKMKNDFTEKYGDTPPPPPPPVPNKPWQ